MLKNQLPIHRYSSLGYCNIVFSSFNYFESLWKEQGDVIWYMRNAWGSRFFHSTDACLQWLIGTKTKGWAMDGWFSRFSIPTLSIYTLSYCVWSAKHWIKYERLFMFQARWQAKECTKFREINWKIRETMLSGWVEWVNPCALMAVSNQTVFCCSCLLREVTILFSLEFMCFLVRHRNRKSVQIDNNIGQQPVTYHLICGSYEILGEESDNSINHSTWCSSHSFHHAWIMRGLNNFARNTSINQWDQCSVSLRVFHTIIFV